jgi:hypothetical protein
VYGSSIALRAKRSWRECCDLGYCSKESGFLILSDEIQDAIYIYIYSVKSKLIGKPFGAHIDNAGIIPDDAASIPDVHLRCITTIGGQRRSGTKP